MKGYAVFKDNWISKNDNVLFNQNNEEFLVLDFQEVVENVLVIDTLPFENGFKERKFSCVKFDKTVKVGDVFYTQ